MLEIKNLTKSFGEQQVLNGVNMSIEKGKIYTLIGGNGSGKTTLFNLITGFLKPDSGAIHFNGKQIVGINPVTVNHLGITRTFQDLRIISQLTVLENILLSFNHNPGEKLLNAMLPPRLLKNQYNGFAKSADQFLEKIHLKSVENNLAGEISYGQQKLLTIGCCLANNADLLLLDEPIAGIDKDNYQRIFDLLLELKTEGKTILQIEHNHGYVEDLSDGFYFLVDGQAQWFADYTSFEKNDVVQDRYLV